MPLQTASPLGPGLTQCLLPAGKTEEKTGGRCQLPWREVYSEIPGQPGPLGGAGGGRGGVSGRGRELSPSSGQRLYTGFWPGCTCIPHYSVGLVGRGSVGWSQTSFLWPTGHPQRVPGGVLQGVVVGVGSACQSLPFPSAFSGLLILVELEGPGLSCRRLQN